MATNDPRMKANGEAYWAALLVLGTEPVDEEVLDEAKELSAVSIIKSERERLTALASGARRFAGTTTVGCA